MIEKTLPFTWISKPVLPPLQQNHMVLLLIQLPGGEQLGGVNELEQEQEQCTHSTVYSQYSVLTV